MSKKAFHSNADRPFAHSTSYIVNKVEHVLGGWGPGTCTVKCYLKKF